MFHDSSALEERKELINFYADVNKGDTENSLDVDPQGQEFVVDDQ